MRFPSGSRVFVSPGKRIEGDSRIVLRFDPAEVDAGVAIDALAEAIDHYGSRLEEVEADSSALEPGFLQAVSGRRLRLHLNEEAVGRAIAMRSFLLPLKPSFVIHEPGVEGVVRCIHAFGSLGSETAVALTPWSGLEALSLEAALVAVDHYLHTPGFADSVQPFHDLLLAQTGARPVDLWDLGRSLPRRDWYLRPDGGIELRTGARRLSLASIDDSDEAVLNSPTLRRATDRFEVLLATRAACAFCAHCRSCGGFFLDEADQPRCEAWKPVFDMLASEYRRGLRELGEVHDRT